jgi:REP element-mobilizing transposase RayT
VEERKTYYRRHLPHYQPEEATFHLVFRLAGSLPIQVIEELRIERQRFERQTRSLKGKAEQQKQRDQFRFVDFRRFDALLDGSKTGPKWLGERTVASIVKEAIHHRDGRAFDLLAYCIMPNHVHMVAAVGRNVIPTYKHPPLYRALQSLKRYTARQCNLALGRQGSFWQDESYDHVVREDSELERTISYVLENPVNAGLVDSWEKWPWSYCKKEYL